MKRKFTALVLATVLAVLLTACANSPDPTAQPTEEPTAVVTESPTEEPTEEPDWRSLGEVERFTAFRDGDNAYGIALCIEDDAVLIYLDSREKTLFAPPITVPGMSKELYESENDGMGPVVFADIDDDGRDELVIELGRGNESTERHFYKWDAEKGEFLEYTPAPVVTEIDHYAIKTDIRAILTDEEYELYKKAIDAILAHEERVELSDDYDRNLLITSALQHSPYYFFVEKERFVSNHTAIKYTYKFSVEEQNEMTEFIDSEYLSILAEIIPYPNMNDLEKTIAVYQYFAAFLSYDYEWLEEHTAPDGQLDGEISLYEGLSTGRGVCHTYSYLCEFALHQLGIENLLILGNMLYDSNISHMWNIVKLNGNYYHFDATWESPDSGMYYFGMTDHDRENQSIDISYMFIDSVYGEVSCTDESLEALRDAWYCVIRPGHILETKCFSGGTVLYNAETWEFIE